MRVDNVRIYVLDGAVQTLQSASPWEQHPPEPNGKPRPDSPVPRGSVWFLASAFEGVDGYVRGECDAWDMTAYDADFEAAGSELIGQPPDMNTATIADKAEFDRRRSHLCGKTSDEGADCPNIIAGHGREQREGQHSRCKCACDPHIRIAPSRVSLEIGHAWVMSAGLNAVIG